MASDKARFYLERYVPELQEYQQKGIFTHDEIISIASKRNDFEHTLNARGSRPTDYARYATYEMNLDTLRKKRSKRFGVKTTTFSGQRTIFFVLDRGTKKFPGDMALWMQYIHFCQREKANKKLVKVFTNVLRLKPRDWGLWVLAAKHYAESQGDMSTARSYMQRGLRFCKDEPRLWIEYMRLEMVYLAKLATRRKILGLDEQVNEVQPEDDDADMIALPAITAADFQPDGKGEIQEMDVETEVRLQNLSSTPALAGAIPMAVFDAAMKEFDTQVQIAEQFFELVESFGQVPASPKILQHILSAIQTEYARSPAAIICEARLSMCGIDATDPEFPLALGQTLTTVNDGLATDKLEHRSQLATKALLLLLSQLRGKEELDEDVVRVLESTVRRYLRILQSQSGSGSSPEAVEMLIRNLRKDDRDADAAMLQEYCQSIALQ